MIRVELMLRRVNESSVLPRGAVARNGSRKHRSHTQSRSRQTSNLKRQPRMTGQSD